MQPTRLAEPRGNEERRISLPFAILAPGRSISGALGGCACDGGAERTAGRDEWGITRERPDDPSTTPYFGPAHWNFGSQRAYNPALT